MSLTSLTRPTPHGASSCLRSSRPERPDGSVGTAEPRPPALHTCRDVCRRSQSCWGSLSPSGESAASAQLMGPWRSPRPRQPASARAACPPHCPWLSSSAGVLADVGACHEASEWRRVTTAVAKTVPSSPGSAPFPTAAGKLQSRSGPWGPRLRRGLWWAEPWPLDMSGADPRACEFTLRGRGDLADEIKLKTWRREDHPDYLGVSGAITGAREVGGGRTVHVEKETGQWK